MAPRLYFEDALTGREVETPWNGRSYSAAGPAGASPRRDVIYDDTAFAVDVDLGRGRHRTVTAEDFPGRLVVAKLWSPGVTAGLRAVQRRLLVSRDDGFVAPSELRGRVTHDALLTNHKALEYLAARRRAMSSATVERAFGKAGG